MNKKFNLEHGFNLVEAEIFVKRLFAEIFVNGKIEEIANFYTDDFIGHYGDELVSLTDIKKRVTAIKNETTRCYMNLREIGLIENSLISAMCTQSWINKIDGSFHDTLLFVLYRIRNRKICEAWMFFDSPTLEYTNIKTGCNKHMQLSELNYQTKYNFLSRVDLILNAGMDKNIKLATMEKECLYYYFHGFSAKETALEMSLSVRTVEKYIANIKEKFACQDKQGLRKKLFPRIS